MKKIIEWLAVRPTVSVVLIWAFGFFLMFLTALAFAEDKITVQTPDGEKELTESEMKIYFEGAHMGYWRAIDQVMGVCWSTEVQMLILTPPDMEYRILCTIYPTEKKY